MNGYEPSPDFADRVMREVRACKRVRTGLILACARYLAAGWALLGVLRAAPVF